MSPIALRTFRAGLAGLALCTLAGCALLPDAAPERPTQEDAGPTLGAHVPSDWHDLRHRSGLVYSVPPEWAVVAEDAPDGAEARTPADDSLDWGFGVLTSANAEAQRGYCALPGTSSFRVRVGLTDPISGDAESITASMSRSMGGAMDTMFSEHGSEVDLGAADKIGVSGALAYHQTIRGTPNEPRSICTPPTIRADVIGVSIGNPDAPETVALLLMTDEDEPGVEPEAMIDQVLGSLRFDNMA